MPAHTGTGKVTRAEEETRGGDACHPAHFETAKQRENTMVRIPSISSRASAFPATAVALLAVALAACDSATGPSIPRVAGTYTGPLAVEATAVFQGTPTTVTATGSMRLVVEQVEDQVTLSGSMTILGDTESLGTISGRIDGAGVWTEAGANVGALVFEDDECGYTADSEFRFSGASLTIEMTATRPEPTSDCPNIRMSAELIRS